MKKKISFKNSYNKKMLTQFSPAQVDWLLSSFFHSIKMRQLYFANETSYSEHDKKLFKALTTWLKLIAGVGILLQILVMHDWILSALFNALNKADKNRLKIRSYQYGVSLLRNTDLKLQVGNFLFILFFSFRSI